MTNDGEGKYGPIRNWTRERFLAHGGMGEVFIGKNIDNGELFVVKSVASEPVWSKQLAALKNEELILRKLTKKKCPNVVRTVGNATSERVAEMGGKPTMDLFLEFQKLRGNITDIVKRTGKLEESVAKGFTFQILQALACMHRNGIVHCDIRGTNVIVCERVVKLVGFGRAKDIGRHLTKQCSWPLRGKEADSRLSSIPEKSIDTEDTIDTQETICPHSEIQEDISALGMVVCEMVTGRRPELYSSLQIEEAIQSLKENFAMRNMSDCQNFIEDCLRENDIKGISLRTEHWTAEHLLTHPWIASMEPFGPFDISFDDKAALGTLTLRENPTLCLKTEAITQTATSPRVTSLRKCADKLCCRTMDMDTVIPPLSSRLSHSENKSRKGARLSRLLLF